MKAKHSLFSQVALARDLPEYNLKRGDVATIVEHYPMPEGEEDGYSLEGFDVPQVTIEVAASQIIPIAQWQQEELILVKLRQLSEARLLELTDFLDFRGLKSSLQTVFINGDLSDIILYQIRVRYLRLDWAVETATIQTKSACAD